MKINLLNILFTIFTLSVFSQETNFTTSEVVIPVKSVTIKGTLLKSTVGSNANLVIIIPGSGPTNRDGNSIQANNNSLKYLAEGLADNGVHSYRFDKSVISFNEAQKNSIDTLTFNAFIQEAIEIVNYFKKTNIYSKIIIAGHSQGSLVGMLASHKNVDGFISLEGAARSIDKILIEQIEKQAPFLKEETVAITYELKKGNTVNEMSPLLNSIFKKDIQPFLISWMQFNPTEEIKNLAIPVLIINGTKDIQVPVSDAELLKAAHPKATLKIIENMNHIFKNIEGDINENMISYSNPNIPIHEELVEIIVNFINEIN